MLHFHFEKPEGIEYVHGHIETYWSMLDVTRDELHTTQIEFLNDGLLEEGHRVFIHPIASLLREPFEIVIGDNRPLTEREIHGSHKLLRMILAGEFGPVT